MTAINYSIHSAARTMGVGVVVPKEPVLGVEPISGVGSRPTGSTNDGAGFDWKAAFAQDTSLGMDTPFRVNNGLLGITYF